ncbi:hypothetical protein PROPEN_03214 [Proteus penneri ATCC 35198]|nr:hypothetical protein PROPEN_03214 [Proteus penneri ATCC 35198]
MLSLDINLMLKTRLHRRVFLFLTYLYLLIIKNIMLLIHGTVFHKTSFM